VTTKLEEDDLGKGVRWVFLEVEGESMFAGSKRPRCVVNTGSRIP